MLTTIFYILFIFVFARLIAVAIKASWGIAKVAACIIVIPICLIAMALYGLVVIAFPILIAIGVVEIVKVIQH